MFVLPLDDQILLREQGHYEIQWLHQMTSHLVGRILIVRSQNIIFDIILSFL